MSLSFDPHQLPHYAVDDHLPSVESHRLLADALRQRFLRPPVWEPEIKIEPRFSERGPTGAAVLIPLVQREGLNVLLTQRTDHLHDHPGQVSFPGGRAEPEDPDATATALREAEEEVGLLPRHVDVLGALPTYTTGTGFVVTPVVGLVTPGFTLTPDPFEVAEIFEVPLSFLMTPANHRRHRAEFAGAQHQFLSMPYEVVGEGGELRRYFIWGATAAMLRNLYRFLSA